MIINVKKTILYHIGILIISYLLMYTLFSFRLFTFKFIIMLIPMVLYFLAGYKLNLNQPRKYDFMSVSVIAIINFVLWFMSFLSSGRNLLTIPEEMAGYWLLVNTFNPYLILISQSFNYKLDQPIINLLFTFLPSILLWIGLKWKRLRTL